jgi:cellulose biosynthesis protein BcsQ
VKRGRIITVANMKGGVGKTTTVVMLAEALAARATARKGGGLNKVLVVDVDPQSSASYCIAGDDDFAEMIKDGQTVDAYVHDQLLSDGIGGLIRHVRPFASGTQHKGEQLEISLIACGVELRRRERELTIALNRRGFDLEAGERAVWDRLLPDIDMLRGQYDYVVFDCAPGLSLMTDIAIRAADLVVATSMPDYLSRRGLEMFVQSTWLDPSGLPPPRRLPYVLVTRFQQNIRQHKKVLEQLELEAASADRHWHLFKTHVPVSAHLAETLEPTNGWPTITGRYRNLVSEVLDPLVDELKEYLDGP